MPNSWTESLDATTKRSLKIWRQGEITTKEDICCQEHFLELYIQDKLFARLLCSGQNLEWLVLGYLASAGLVKRADDLADLLFKPSEKANVIKAFIKLEHEVSNPDLTLTSAMSWQACQQRLKILEPPQQFWSPEIICQAGLDLQNASVVFKQTGGCHNACLISKEETLLTCFDIGRHNAIDTTIGYMLWHGLDPRKLAIISSGRIATEIVSKAIMARIPVFASLAAAMGNAIDIAKQYGLTLISRVRPDSLQICAQAGHLTC